MNVLRKWLAACLLVLPLSLQAADGLIAVQSALPAAATMEKIESAVKDRGLTVFARIDHAAGAEKIGKSLRPTTLLIFGGAAGGTPLMECAQTAGIDLPLKALVWTDEAGKTWVGYNDPAYIGKRHGVPNCPAVATLAQALSRLIMGAVAQ